MVSGGSDTFDNGLTLAWRGEARLERDAASRPAFAGVLGDCPAANALLPAGARGARLLVAGLVLRPASRPMGRWPTRTVSCNA